MYVVCKHHDYRFFHDYLTALQPYLPHTVIDSVDTLDMNHVYIFVLSIPDQFVSYPNIMYLNTEQLTQPRWFHQVCSYLQRGIRVLDYDLYQSRMTGSSLHRYLPYPYEPDLTELVRTTPNVYDVGICSINSERRHAMALALSRRGVHVVDICDWGKERDRRIAQCRILLNVHYAENYQIFEHVRCDRWIMAGMHIVTEPSLSDPLLDIRSFMTIVAYDNMVEKIIELLTREQKRVDINSVIKKRHECLNLIF